MRTKLGAILLFFIILFIGLGAVSYTLYSDFTIEEEISDFNGLEIRSEHVKKELKPILEGELFSYIEAPLKDIEHAYGEPLRKDATPYGYTWYVYEIADDYYVQFGIEDEQVVTIFGTGDSLPIEPFKVGMSYGDVQAYVSFQDRVTYEEGISFYSFLLNVEDKKSQPLVQLSSDVFAQFYFDTFTNTLSSIRIATGKVLIRQRFYEMEYRGTLPEDVELSDEAWQLIEKGKEKQIVTLTNLYRKRYGVQKIEVDEDVSVVAKLHSKDMFEHNYFSHESQDGRGLKERLDEKNIFFIAAGENIAAQYTDAPAVVEGWLNSEGHREALLEGTYTHLGVGVYRDFYTQNFITKH